MLIAQISRFGAHAPFEAGLSHSVALCIIAAMSRIPKSAVARPTRADAVRNRGAILEAAADIFACHGEYADVREIARCAGVGMGTLYRHFPTKDALLETVLREQFDEWTRTARDAARNQADPAEALAVFLHDALERQARHRALVERFAETWHTSSGVAACRRELHPVINDLLTRCHEAGALRPGVTTDDITLLLVALGRIAQLAVEQGCPELWQRALQITLDGLQPSHQSPLPEG